MPAILGLVLVWPWWFGAAPASGAPDAAAAPADAADASVPAAPEPLPDAPEPPAAEPPAAPSAKQLAGEAGVRYRLLGFAADGSEAAFLATRVDAERGFHRRTLLRLALPGFEERERTPLVADEAFRKLDRAGEYELLRYLQHRARGEALDRLGRAGYVSVPLAPQAGRQTVPAECSLVIGGVAITLNASRPDGVLTVRQSGAPAAREWLTLVGPCTAKGPAAARPIPLRGIVQAAVAPGGLHCVLVVRGRRARSDEAPAGDWPVAVPCHLLVEGSP